MPAMILVTTREHDVDEQLIQLMMIQMTRLMAMTSMLM